MNILPEKLFFFCGKPFIEQFSHFLKIAEVQLCNCVSQWCKEVIDGARSGEYWGCKRISHSSDFTMSCYFWSVRWSIVMSQNHFAMSFGPFCLLLDKCAIQIDHLLMIALSVDGFSGLQEFIINNTALVPPDTKHVFSAKAFWS